MLCGGIRKFINAISDLLSVRARHWECAAQQPHWRCVSAHRGLPRTRVTTHILHTLQFLPETPTQQPFDLMATTADP